MFPIVILIYRKLNTESFKCRKLQRNSKIKENNWVKPNMEFYPSRQGQFLKEKQAPEITRFSDTLYMQYMLLYLGTTPKYLSKHLVQKITNPHNTGLLQKFLFQILINFQHYFLRRRQYQCQLPRHGSSHVSSTKVNSSTVIYVVGLYTNVVSIYTKIAFLVPPRVKTDCVHGNIKLWTGTIYK